MVKFFNMLPYLVPLCYLFFMFFWDGLLIKCILTSVTWTIIFRSFWGCFNLFLTKLVIQVSFLYFWKHSFPHTWHSSSFFCNYIFSRNSSIWWDYRIPLQDFMGDVNSDYLMRHFFLNFSLFSNLILIATLWV